MKTVWKYAIDIKALDKDSAIVVDMPLQSQILSVGDDITTQDTPDQFNVWAEVETTKYLKPHKFVVIGTGHPAPANAIWLGTVAKKGFALVWHLYQVFG